MRTATSNLVVLEAEIVDDQIMGTAIDGDIKIVFTVAPSEVNQRMFMPEANLVVTGKFRLGREICTIGIWIESVIAVVSLPVAVTAEIEAPAEIEVPVPATKQKHASSRTKNAKVAAGEIKVRVSATKQKRASSCTKNAKVAAGEPDFSR